MIIDILLKNDKIFNGEDLKELFYSVGWEFSTDAHILVEAMKNASNVVSAWDNNKLIGIARSMDDGCWSANIDCCVVHKQYQNQGIGTKIMRELIDNIKHIKYINVSPNENKNIGFYEKVGFKVINESKLLQIRN